jgi:hypothetical protein
MSTTPHIKNLVRLSLLERVTPELLVRFLRPYESFLVDRGLSLDGGPHDHAWVGALHRVLNTVDATMPGVLVQAFLDVADLASEQGHEAALNLAGERQLNLFAKSGVVSAEDLAFRLYIEHSDVFAATHARVQSQEVRRFVDFHPTAHRPLAAADSEPKRLLLVNQLSRWFASRNRSEYVDVRVSESSDEVSFLIIHGQPPRSVSVITSPSSRDRMSLVPDKQDTVVFDKASGRLSINAQYAAEHDFYRSAIGKVFFGNDSHFTPHEVLDCSVLLDDPVAALSVEGLPALDAVVLREVVLEAIDSPRDKLSWSASDLREVFLNEVVQLMTRDRVVRRVKLALYPAGSSKAKLVELAPPNKLTYDRRTHDAVVREFLFARGFLRHPQAAMASLRAMA